MRRLLSLLAMIFLCLLVACGSPTPPTEFAPDGKIVQKALLLQLRHTTDRVSQSLQSSHPNLKIEKIQVKSLEPVYVGDLAAYHLRGAYDLLLSLPHQNHDRQHNDFDLYLQRQIEGKTWRLLERSGQQWKSYLVE